MSEGSLAFNPEFDPDGAEGGVDTNLLPWLPLSGVAGLSLKPLRASMESGMFSMIVRLEKGAVLDRLLSLSGMDLLVHSGAMDYADDSGESEAAVPAASGDTDLTDIDGIGPKFAEELVAAGVANIAALAALSDEKKAELAESIKGDDIDGWVEQAQALSGAASEEEE